MYVLGDEWFLTEY